MWAVFEAAIAPLIGVQDARHRGVAGHVVLAADYALYGIVVAGQLAPESPAKQAPRHRTR